MVDFIVISLGVDDDSAAVFQSAVRQFVENISLPPLCISGCIVEPDKKLLETLNEAITQEQDIADVSLRIADHFVYGPDWNGGPLPKVVVACLKTSRLANLVQKNNPLAEWGGSIGILSIVYHFDPPLIWHEMFHLLGAKDCYDAGLDGSTFQDHTCGHLNCVMQYAPSLATVGDPPFLCTANIEEILKFWPPKLQ